VRAIQQGFSSNPEILITDSANAAVNKTTVLLAAGDRTTFTVFAVVTPSAGSVTYKARATTGIGTLDTEVSSTQPALFLVEDIGPAGAPA
jgi:hypothetical protein